MAKKKKKSPRRPTLSSPAGKRDKKKKKKKKKKKIAEFVLIYLILISESDYRQTRIDGLAVETLSTSPSNRHSDSFLNILRSGVLTALFGC